MSDVNREAAIKAHMALQPKEAKLLEVFSLSQKGFPKEMLQLTIEAPDEKGDLVQKKHMLFVEK